MNVLIDRAVARPTLALLALLAAAACAESNDTSSERATMSLVTVVARDHSYDMPAEIPAGLVRMILRNEGPEPHHAQPVRLNDGVTLERFTAELRRDPEAALALVSFPGGPGPVPAGGSQEVTLDLTEGQYVMLCFVESPDGTPHLAKGMITPFRVTGRGADGTSRPVDGEVTLRDFGFVMPEVTAGESTLRVTNAGPQVHEIAIVKPLGDTSARDVLAFLRDPEGSPPFVPAGGMQALEPGAGGWLHLDLAPGTYVAICLVPDPASGRPHIDLGMIAEFTVE